MNKYATSAKNMIQQHVKALARFNEWENSHVDDMEDQQKLALVFELYDLIPESARQRDVNVEGIMKMRRALPCLK